MLNLFKGGIKGRLFLTIRQRGGNNPVKGGKGGWEMKKRSVFVAFLLGALVLVGWGCGQNSAAPADANLDTNVSETSSDNTPEATSDMTGEVPAGWTEYRNERWGVNFIYPAGWQYQEYSETVEGEGVVTLAFSDQELPETLPPEPLFPIMVTRDSRSVSEVVAVHAGAVSIEDSSFGGRVVKVITRYSDILEANYRIYVVPLRSGSMQFVPMDTSYVSMAETMISNLTETE